MGQANQRRATTCWVRKKMERWTSGTQNASFWLDIRIMAGRLVLFGDGLGSVVNWRREK